MSTKVFISWSGDLSRQLAEALQLWLPGVLQFVRPYFTPTDIEKGTKWASEIAGELESSEIGIICITKENLTEPWILFESGALSKNLEKSRVCTLLFGIDPTDLKGPLTTFQSTRFEKKEFRKLVSTINNAGGENKLDDSVLDQVFNMWWEKLKKQIEDIILNYKGTDESEQRSERDLLEEILGLSRLAARGQTKFEPFWSITILRLLQSLMELQLILEDEDFPQAQTVIKNMHRSLKFLARRSGHPAPHKQDEKLKLSNRVIRQALFDDDDEDAEF